MSLQHFYLHDQVLADEGAPTFPLRLSPDDAKHARVLRLAPGEHIAVVDAAQDYFECEITAFDDAVPVVRIAQRLDDEERQAEESRCRTALFVDVSSPGKVPSFDECGEERARCHSCSRRLERDTTKEYAPYARQAVD